MNKRKQRVRPPQSKESCDKQKDWSRVCGADLDACNAGTQRLGQKELQF